MIEVKDLCKSYGGHRAVSDLSFNIEKGQIYGFLGPNGAGKSSTLNIITGCLGASSGTVRVGGYDIFENPREAKRLIGYLPEQPPLYMDRTPLEYLRFVGQAKGLAGTALRRDIERVMELTELGEMSRRLIKNLSKGYRQRLGIAQALLASPEVIILDEPTSGLDPRQITEIRALIKALGESHTVLLSSHILSEVRAVCGFVLIISEGRLAAGDSPENLERLFAGSALLELTVKAEEKQLSPILTALPELKKYRAEPSGDGCFDIALELEGADSLSLRERLFFAFASAGLPIVRMESSGASLEDVFIQLTQAEKEAEE